MLDIKYIREHPEETKTALLKRMKPENLDIDGLLALDDKRRQLESEVEKLRAERNQSSKTKPTLPVLARMKAVGDKIKDLEVDLNKIKAKFLDKISN